MHGWQCESGDYAATVQTLIAAGAGVPAISAELQASPAVREVLSRLQK